MPCFFSFHVYPFFFCYYLQTFHRMVQYYTCMHFGIPFVYTVLLTDGGGEDADVDVTRLNGLKADRRI
jgi:hypothetical protein